MKTLLIICAIILAGGASTRMAMSISDRNKPLWIIFAMSAVEILALGTLFRFFVVPI